MHRIHADGRALRAPSGALTQFLKACQADLDALERQGVRRQLQALEAARGTTIALAGCRLTNWSANDYLGLSQHPDVIRAASQAARRWGVGARASRLLAGTTALHAQLEAHLAAFFHVESSLVFASGYLANLGALTCLLRPGDTVFVDRLAHASLIDACRASRATLRVFRHNDVDQLRSLLRRARSGKGRRVIVTEGVFSMDGDRAPLRGLLAAADAADALLYLDDAHGAFVLGATGRGSPELAGIAHDRLIYMATLGKALGAQGGFVAGSRRLIEWLHNRAKTFIYATALATPVVAAADAALRVVATDRRLRHALRRNAERLHASLRAARIPTAEEASHIAPVLIGSSAHAQRVAAWLRERGEYAPAIRPPTVPAGTARLRISLSALHRPQDIARLVRQLRACPAMPRA